MNSQLQLVQSNIGVGVKFIRLPWGKTNANVQEVIQSMGLTQTTYNLDPNDYANCKNVAGLTSAMYTYYNTQFTAYKNAGNLQGSFISLHTDLCNEANAIEKSVMLAKDFKYDIVSIDKCLGVNGKYTNGTFKLT